MNRATRIGMMAALAASAALWTMADAAACRCPLDARPLAVRVAADKPKSDGIFLGTVRWSAGGSYLFRVGNIFKGSVDKYVRVAVKESSMCGYQFEVGKAYVVFAKGGNGVYQNPGTCGGLLTMPAQSAAALMQLLGFGQPPAGERIPDELDEPCQPGMARPAAGGRCAPIPVVPAGRKLSCKTAGDAMSSLTISVARTGLSLFEATMGDKTFTFGAAAPAAQLADFGAGKALTLVGTAADTAAFGGAQSPAVLLSLGAATTAGSQSGYYARGGIVFKLSCAPPSTASPLVPSGK